MQITFHRFEIEHELAARASLAARAVQPWPSDSSLCDLIRAENALNLMLDGLRLHYSAAIAQGRMKEWAEAGHSIINLMATQHRVATIY